MRIMRNLVCIGVLATCSFLALPTAEAGKDFEALLDHLPSDSELVILIDLSEGNDLLNGLLSKIQNTAVVAQSPELKKMVQQQRAMMETELAARRVELGFDPLKDIKRVVVGVSVKNPAKPKLVVVFQGKFPADVGKRLGKGAEAELVEAIEAYRVDGEMMVSATGDKVVLASAEHIVAAVQAKNSAAFAELHPGLLAPQAKGFFLRMSFVVPDMLRSLAQAEEARPVATLVRSLIHVTVEVDERTVIGLACTDAAGAERAEYLAKAQREFMIGGAHMWRAYAQFALGFDLANVPGLPPQVAKALQNRAALEKTVDEFFPQPGAKPVVTKNGNTVTLTAPPEMMQGSVFVLGIAAAVAIPALVSYQSQSKASVARVNVQMVKTAIDVYKLEHMKLPTSLDELVKAGFLQRIPEDGFGNKLEYVPLGGGDTYLLSARGANIAEEIYP